MPEAMIVSAVRTPVGRARKGSLVDVRPEDLAAGAISTALREVPELDPVDVDDVVVGCGFPEQRQGMNVGRRAALLAGLPDTVPGTTVNRFCASSLQAIRMAFHAISAGEGDVFVAAGVESVSQVNGYPKTDEEYHPKLRGEIADAYVPMGITAENVAKRFGVRREEMDRFAQQSHERAVAARDAGFFARELRPVTLDDGTVVSDDDGPRRDSSLERLAALEPAFAPDGTVIAGNACPLSDGAAAVVVMSDTKARALGIAPRARIIASAVSGIAPEIMGVGPIEAVRKVLRTAQMTLDEVELVELNEAFAAQVLPVCSELGIDPFGDRLNPHGGAIALGHPFGMTGARIMCTLLNGLEALDRRIGLETMCVGGGQGMACSSSGSTGRDGRGTTAFDAANRLSTPQRAGAPRVGAGFCTLGAMRRVCVTGGSRGVGRAVVERFAAAGDEVLALGRDEEALRATVDATGGMDGAVRYALCDVADERSVEEVLSQSGPFDVLVNNAGTARSDPIARTTLDEWNRQLAVNATGAFLCTRAVLPSMRERDSGRIVMVASTAAHVGSRYTSAYTASKHALVGLVRATALEVAASGITVNAVCPGFIRSPMTQQSIARIVELTGREPAQAEAELATSSPLGRLLEPEEVAFAVSFLAAPQAGAINGQTIVIDGGGVQR
jgi:acetyl-CoA C-acetyltransferase